MLKSYLVFLTTIAGAAVVYSQTCNRPDASDSQHPQECCGGSGIHAGLQPTTTNGALHIFDTYTIPCDGEVFAWSIQSLVSGSFFVGIFRPSAQFTGEFELVDKAQNISVANADLNWQLIPAASQISAKRGDRIGIFKQFISQPQNLPINIASRKLNEGYSKAFLSVSYSSAVIMDNRPFPATLSGDYRIAGIVAHVMAQSNTPTFSCSSASFFGRIELLETRRISGRMVVQYRCQAGLSFLNGATEAFAICEQQPNGQYLWFEMTGLDAEFKSGPAQDCYERTSDEYKRMTSGAVRCNKATPSGDSCSETPKWYFNKAGRNCYSGLDRNCFKAETEFQNIFRTYAECAAACMEQQWSGKGKPVSEDDRKRLIEQRAESNRRQLQQRPEFLFQRPPGGPPSAYINRPDFIF